MVSAREHCRVSQGLSSPLRRNAPWEPRTEEADSPWQPGAQGRALQTEEQHVRVPWGRREVGSLEKQKHKEEVFCHFPLSPLPGRELACFCAQGHMEVWGTAGLPSFSNSFLTLTFPPSSPICTFPFLCPACLSISPPRLSHTHFPVSPFLSLKTLPLSSTSVSAFCISYPVLWSLLPRG